jgi:hypothetical protein
MGTVIAVIVVARAATWTGQNLSKTVVRLVDQRLGIDPEGKSHG